MDLLCPECMGALVSSGGDSMRCSIHGGQYRVLFLREPHAVASASAAIPVGENEACANHPNVAAETRCSACGAAICNLCAVAQPDGSQFCASCFTHRATARTPSAALLPVYRPPAVASGTKCRTHSEVDAVQRCVRCSAPVCSTCDFVFPGNVHLCPQCAASPQKTVTGTRKKTLVFSYILAAWCSVGLVLLFSGVFARMMRTSEDVEMIGIVIWIGIMIPSLIGTGLSVGSMDKRLGNSTAVWIATIWNAIILGVLILLIILGNMKK